VVTVEWDTVRGYFPSHALFTEFSSSTNWTSRNNSKFYIKVLTKSFINFFFITVNKMLFCRRKNRQEMWNELWNFLTSKLNFKFNSLRSWNFKTELLKFIGDMFVIWRESFLVNGVVYYLKTATLDPSTVGCFNIW